MIRARFPASTYAQDLLGLAVMRALCEAALEQAVPGRVVLANVPSCVRCRRRGYHLVSCGGER